jgi:cytochrome c556
VMTPKFTRGGYHRNGGNQDRQAWIKLAHGLHDAATLALNAADAKDPAKVLESGEQIDNACEHCHQQYWYPHPAQSSGK